MSLPNVIQLTFDGVTVTLNPDHQGRYRLNDIHRASGGASNKRPNYWINNAQTVDLIDKLSSAGNPAVLSVNGGAGRGSYGIPEIVFAYASWISAEFHSVVLETFSAAVSGDGAKAVEVAQSVARTDGKVSRKGFVSGLAKHGADRSFYGDMSDTVNLIILGKTSSAMKDELGIKQYKSLRDHLPDNTLLALGAVEALAAARLAMNADPRRAIAREITYNSANDVKTLLGM